LFRVASCSFVDNLSTFRKYLISAQFIKIVKGLQNM